MAEMHDEALFGEPPPQHGDCPICFLRLPFMASGRRYMDCCGKIICTGCCYADVYDNLGNVIADEKCPFCRTPLPTSGEEILKMLKKRMEVGDSYAFFMMGNAYLRGRYGSPLDSAKAVKMWRKAGKFGYANIGFAYDNGNGVERDEKMASHYDELAAMGGIIEARHNLGVLELEGHAGNMSRALRHFMITAGCGDNNSLENIKQLFMNGHATKDDYAKALQVYQANLVEIKSPQRDEAATFNEERYKYY